MSEITIQTFQGAGFQKGGVFDTSANPNCHLDRPRSGFFAGAVYGAVAAAADPGPPAMGGSFVSGGSFSGGGTFGGGTFGGGTFSSH